MRAVIKPNFKAAKERYDKILAEILSYTDYCDENGDEYGKRYEVLKQNIKAISGKNADEFDVVEWWEADGAENIAFDIALPEPNLVPDITKTELTEIIERMCSFCEREFDDEFLDAFYGRAVYTSYFHDFLELNFKDSYSHKLFTRQKINGEMVELSAGEIVEILWADRN